VIKDPLSLKYYRLQPEQFLVLQHLDGVSSLEDLKDRLQVEFPAIRVTSGEVQSLILDLFEKDLLCSGRPGQGENILKKKRTRFLSGLRQSLLNPTFIRFPGWDPDPLLIHMTPWCGWIFSVAGLVLCVSLILSSWLFVLIRFDEIRRRLPEFQQFFGWPNLIFLWITMAFMKVLHEFGHGVACKHFGGECHSMGIVIMVFSPTLYCDVTDSWMMKNKWHRILISAGGMYVEMILSTFAIILWYHSKPGLIHHLSLNVFFVSTVSTILFNINPLLRYDGYYILSDFLEVPNLQARCSHTFNRFFSWSVLGKDYPEDPFTSATGQPWLMLYLAASSLYRWLIVFSVAIFLYSVLKPYRLQSLGFMAAIFSILTTVGGACGTILKLAFSPRQDPISRMKLLTLLTLLIGTAFAFLWLPVPWYEQAACYVEPSNMQHVYALHSGTVVQIAVQPGQKVRSGDLLMQLSSPELVEKLEKFRVAIESQNVELKFMAERKDSEGMYLAQQKLHSLHQQKNECELQLRQLRIEAPLSGRVIAPPRTVSPGNDVLQVRLRRWSGTPLVPGNLGMTLEAGTHVCSIAKEAGFRAILFLHQLDRGDLQAGDPVHVKLDSLPGQLLTGKVISFSEREGDVIPAALSNRFGGPLPATTNSHGQEVLAAAMYQATIELDASSASLLTAERGTARFVIVNRSLADWGWRAFRSLFHFRL